jgi:HD-GYP domain-containing protein (c-di-GMP phosphodiesterase class II)
MRLAPAMDVDDAISRDVFYTSLLRFLGCTAASHGLAELGSGDERHILGRMAATTMGSNLEDLMRLVRVVGPAASPLHHIRLIAAALRDPDAGGLLEAHCEVGARLARDMGLPSTVVEALAMAYARWDGHGIPAGVGGEAIPRALRIAVVARDIELWAHDSDASTAARTVRARRGKAYDPVVVDAALEIGVHELRRDDGDLWETVMRLEPQPMTTVSDEGIDAVLRALGDFADLKHPSRSGHSRRVQRIVADACQRTSWSEPESRMARRAAMVHDVGVVAIPVDALSPETESSPGRAEQLRMHPIWGERLLSRCEVLQPVAAVVSRHHERLDGSGYPAGRSRGLDGASGLLACAELYDELVSNQAGPQDAARQRAQGELVRLGEGGALGRDAIRMVIEAVGDRAPLMDVPRPAGLTEREVQVLRLLALGGTNRAIADDLGISVKTAGAHVEHIYDKIGVGSRAGATLFAARHDLVP